MISALRGYEMVRKDSRRFLRNVLKSHRSNRIQSATERDKGGALGEKHKEPVQALEQVGVSVWFKELEPKGCLLSARPTRLN